MAEKLITENRGLTGFEVDPDVELKGLQADEANLRKQVLTSADQDVDGAIRWCMAMALLMQLGGRKDDARALLEMGKEPMVEFFGPREVVKGMYAILREGQ